MARGYRTEILAFDDVVETLADVLTVDHHVFFRQVWRGKRNLIEQPFENGIEPTRADVFGLFVDTPAILARASTASSVKIISRLSVARRALYCLSKAFCGSHKMRTNSLCQAPAVRRELGSALAVQGSDPRVWRHERRAAIKRI